MLRMFGRLVLCKSPRCDESALWGVQILKFHETGPMEWTLLELGTRRPGIPAKQSRGFFAIAGNKGEMYCCGASSKPSGRGGSVDLECLARYHLCWKMKSIFKWLAIDKYPQYSQSRVSLFRCLFNANS